MTGHEVNSRLFGVYDCQTIHGDRVEHAASDHLPLDQPTVGSARYLTRPVFERSSLTVRARGFGVELDRVDPRHPRDCTVVATTK